MKKVIIHLSSAQDSEAAGQALNALSGVMVTDIQGDTLIVHCGQRLDSETLLNTLHEKGCAASVAGDEHDSYF